MFSFETGSNIVCLTDTYLKLNKHKTRFIDILN